MKTKPLRVVTLSEGHDGLVGHRGLWRHLGQRSSIWPPETERAVELTRDPVAFLVDRAMTPPTEQDEIRQRGWAAVGRMAHMMPLPDAHAAAREATASVSMVQRPPQRGWSGPGANTDLDQPARRIVTHHHPARVARQPPWRLRGNAAPFLESRLARLFWIRQHGRVHVDHHPVPLRRGAGIEALVQRRLREQSERIRLLLRSGWRVRGRVGRGGSRIGAPGPLIQRFTGRVERPHEQRPDFRGEPAPDEQRSILLLAHVQRVTRVPPGRLARLGQPIYPRRQPRTIRSTCAAVPARPTASSRASGPGVATRVSARTLA